MGGGGSDDFSAKQAEIERKKQRGRDALNVSFGVGPTSGAPDRDDFMKVTNVAGSTGGITYGENGRPIDNTYVGEPVVTFDQEAYDKALNEYNTGSGEAQKNKVARDALYDTVRTNAFDAGKRGFDEKKENAARDLKFALFAQGLNGGSVDVDQNATLGRTYNDGILNLGAKADSVRNDLNSSDEQTRLGLLQSIDAGMDQGSAVSSAINQLKVNSDRAAAGAQGTSLGDLFADAGLLYTKSNAARGAQDANTWWQNNYRPPSMKPGGSSGIVTSTG